GGRAGRGPGGAGRPAGWPGGPRGQGKARSAAGEPGPIPVGSRPGSMPRARGGRGRQRPKAVEGCGGTRHRRGPPARGLGGAETDPLGAAGDGPGGGVCPLPPRAGRGRGGGGPRMSFPVFLRAPAVSERALTPEQERYFFASQWRLIWWRLHRHHLAMVAFWFLVGLYGIIPFVELLAPYALR